MYSKSVFTDVIFMLVLVLVQVFVFNNITPYRSYFPVVYPVFVMFYPFYRNRYLFLALSFLLGLGVDALLGTWGINAFATTTIAFFRTLIFRTSTESTTDFFSFSSLQWPQFLLFILASIFTHQLLVQMIEFFKFSRLHLILLDVLISTGISFIFILLYTLVFKIKQRV